MSLHRDVYRADQLPVFQNRMFHSEGAARECTRGDVRLVQSLETGLIFNEAFLPELMDYDQDYQNEQGLSAAFQSHLASMAAVVERHFGGMSLIEVGCGKGRFLEQLQSRGFDITGLDPTYEGTNPRVVKAYFTPQTGLQAEAIVLRHVLEHVQDPVGFLAGLREANGGSGLIYIEVPCLDWIAQRRAWFDIFYEHVNYFRLGDLRRMFAGVLEAGHCFGGQYLYIVADLATLRPPVREPGDLFDLPKDFLSGVATAPSRQCAVWGGASKGVIFSLFMQRIGAKVGPVIDINPAKQGRYLAATGLRVQSPEEGLAGLEPGSDLVVMNSNYLSEIKSLTSNQFNYLVVEHDNV